MGKKPRDKEEQLEQQVRELKSIIRSLHKQLKKQNKRRRGNIKIEEDPLPSDGDCPNCIKGSLKESDIGIRIITTCSNCEYRKVTKSK